MLATGVFFLTVAEFGLYVLLGARCWRQRQMPLWEIVLLCLGIAIMIRALITAYLFAVTEIYRTPRPIEARLGPARFLGLFLRELLALAALYSTVHTLDRWLGQGHPRVKRGEARAPVLLLHGFFCNSAFWWILRRQLHRDGYHNVYTQTLEPVFGDIEHLGDRVGARIDQICAETGASKVVIVGHSMGGLAARAYLRRYGALRVCKLIAVGTPHHGTAHARAVTVLGENLRQMCLNSPWLKQLNAEPLPVPVTNIWSWHDNIVAPQDSCSLEGAKNLAVAGVGHLEMAIDRRVRRLVLQEIESA